MQGHPHQQQTLPSKPERFAFLLLPEFSTMSLSCILEPLKAANRLSGRTLYEWCVVTPDGRPALSASGVRIDADRAVDALERPNLLMAIAGMRPERYGDRHVINSLRHLARQGCRLGAISTGSYLLAKAGLLEGYRCTIHWEYIVGFQEAFPGLDVTDELYEIDRNRMTCSGGTAALDLALSVIAMDHGRELATAVAEQFIHERIRDRHDPQRMSLRARIGVSHPKLLKVIELMEAALEEPLPRSDLARQTGLSSRQLERLFRKYLGRTPTRYYLELRLQKARALLKQTSMSVLDVALACGFVSASHFSKCYREYYAKTPRQERQLEPNAVSA
ncbi:MAG: GlxA family transcriptional regulator [Rhodospirillales bacterium]|nr:GlxA family transcriptional regulator [Rhodospirillales bacterium]